MLRWGRGQSKKNLLIIPLLIYPPPLSSLVSFLTIDRYTFKGRVNGIGNWKYMNMMQFYVIKRNCTNFQNSKIVKKNVLAFDWQFLYNYHTCIWTEYLLMSFCKERVHEIWSEKCFMTVMIIFHKSYYKYDGKKLAK